MTWQTWISHSVLCPLSHLIGFRGCGIISTMRALEQPITLLGILCQYYFCMYVVNLTNLTKELSLFYFSVFLCSSNLYLCSNQTFLAQSHPSLCQLILSWAHYFKFSCLKIVMNFLKSQLSWFLSYLDLYDRTHSDL